MNLSAEAAEEIRSFVAAHPDNGAGPVARYFDEPLVGIASGDDPLFSEYRLVIGPFHWTPREALAAAAEGPLSVVCWVLPISPAVRESNRPETRYPSEQWSLTRSRGEALNVLLRRHMVDWFRNRGIAAAAPQLASEWRQIDDTPAGIASTWSERHAAYAAGLGTFSLNDGLITERGIAHRLGSVVAAVELPATPRPESGLQGNCLYARNGSCGRCIDRCPVGALSRDGHDKRLCMEHVYGTIPREVAQRFGVQQTGCGLCQTAVPCEAINPCRGFPDGSRGAPAPH